MAIHTGVQEVIQIAKGLLPLPASTGMLPKELLNGFNSAI